MESDAAERRSPLDERRRLEIIADALGLPASEIDRAAASEDGLLEFYYRRGQSLDWIVCGDVRPMIRKLWAVRPE